MTANADAYAARLESIISALSADPGLKASVSTRDMNGGIAAARRLNTLLATIIDETGVNADGVISEADMLVISEATRANRAYYRSFIDGHGDDESGIETGFHLLQNDGGILQFKGRKLIDTVIDAIYHFGFPVHDGRFVNEDGNANERAADVAGWLNYFLNGSTVVFGSNSNDVLCSGDYSTAVAAGADEVFEAADGDDEIWAGDGNDTVRAGNGDDTSGGGNGRDTMHGGAGIDTLWGDGDNDRIFGEGGDDSLGGGTGNDLLGGGAGNDEAYGQEGNDTLNGGDGNDQLGGGTGADKLDGGRDEDLLYGDQGDDIMSGSDGNDHLWGGDGSDRLDGGKGNDELNGGNGADILKGDAGADVFCLWDEDGASDRVVITPGDSGRTRATIDRVEGFQSGEDLIDLRSFGPMTFEDLDFAGGGRASAYYDGHYLRIDADGDRATDLIVQFMWVNELAAQDFLLA